MFPIGSLFIILYGLYKNVQPAFLVIFDDHGVRRKIRTDNLIATYNLLEYRGYNVIEVNGMKLHGSK